MPDDAARAGGREGFTACDEGKLRQLGGRWRASERQAFAARARDPSRIDELWILDVDGELVMIDAMYGAETPAEHVD